MPVHFNSAVWLDHVKRGVARGGRHAHGVQHTSRSQHGITMWHRGHKTRTSLLEVIAPLDRSGGAPGTWFDALIVLGSSCDKTIPVGANGLLRVDLPGLFRLLRLLHPPRAVPRGPRRPPSRTSFEALGANAREDERPGPE